MSVLEPLEHSVMGVSLEGGEESIDNVALPYLLEHSGLGRTEMVCRTADVVSVGTGTVRAFGSGSAPG